MKEPSDKARLCGIVEKAEAGIMAVVAVENLLSETYGAGCVNLHSHAGGEEIRKAAQTLSFHLALLKHRAAALAMLPEASADSISRFEHILR